MMEYTKLFSIFGSRLTLADKHRQKSEMIIANKKANDLNRLKQNEQEDIFNIMTTPSKEKTMNNLVLKFKSHVTIPPLEKKQQKRQSILFSSEQPFAKKHNPAIDYERSMITTKPRIPPSEPNSNFYIDNDFKIEHKVFINMTKMQPRLNKWLQLTQSSISLSKDKEEPDTSNHHHHYCNTISGRDLTNTITMSIKESRPSHLKELPRQICHSPKLEAVLPKTKGNVDFSALEKKTKSRLVHGSLRYHFLDKKQNPEYNDYSTECIEKNNAKIDFRNYSKVREHNDSGLPLFMCKIHSASGNYVMTDKSLQLNNYAMTPLGGSHEFSSSEMNKKKTMSLIALNKSKNDKKNKETIETIDVGENCFKHIKAKKYQRYTKHMKRYFDFYKMKL